MTQVPRLAIRLLLLAVAVVLFVLAALSAGGVLHDNPTVLGDLGLASFAAAFI